MFTFAKLCRLCFKNNCVLINYAEFDLENISYYDKLKKIIPMLVSECYKHFPPWICLGCKEELNKFYIFYQKCFKTHNLLKIYSDQLSSMSTTINPKVSLFLQTENSISNTNLSSSSVSIKTEDESFEESESIQDESINAFDEDTLIFNENSSENNIHIVKNEIPIIKEEPNHQTGASFTGILKDMLEKNVENNLMKTKIDITIQSINNETTAILQKQPGQQNSARIHRKETSTSIAANNVIEKSTQSVPQEEILNTYLSVERTTGLKLRIKRTNPLLSNALSDDDNEFSVFEDSNFQPEDYSNYSIDLKTIYDPNPVHNISNLIPTSFKTNTPNINHSVFSLDSSQEVLNKNSNNAIDLITTMNDQNSVDNLSSFISTSFKTTMNDQNTLDNSSLNPTSFKTNILNNSVSSIEIPTTNNAIDLTTTINHQMSIDNVPTSSKIYIKTKDDINKTNLDTKSTIINHQMSIDNVPTSSKIYIKTKEDLNKTNNLGTNETFNNIATTSCRDIPKNNLPKSVESTEDDFGIDDNLCKICNKRFRNLENHLAVHRKENYLQCPYCVSSFPLRNGLFDHLKRVHCLVEPICKICNAIFQKTSLLFVHMHVHYGVNVFKCPHCEDLFTHAKTVFRHIATIHGDSSLKCFKCNKSFNAFETLLKHFHEHYAVKGNFICNICGKEFSENGKLKEHTRTKHVRHICSVCGKHYSTAKVLRHHHQAKHENVTFKCDVCPKEFNSNWHLYNHKKIHNESAKKFQCKTCGKLFLYKIILTNHERTHSGDKPFKCKICGKGFSQPTSVVTHMRTHTGDRPFKCQECDKSYTQSYAYKMHMKKHHNKEENETKVS